MRCHLRSQTAINLSLLVAALGAPCAPAIAQASLARLYEPQPMLLAVTVNGQQQGEPLLFLKGEGGSLYAPATAFAKWRLKLPADTPI